MATFTIDELREAADKRYAPLVIEAGEDTFKLPTLLRLETKKRKQVIKLLAQLETEVEGDSEDAIEEALAVFRKLIIQAEVNGNGQKLIDLIDDDAVLIDVVGEWLELTQAGEA